MTSIGFKPSFMSGLHYLSHQQYNGKGHGDMQMINSRFEFGKNLYSKDLFAHYGCVNAIEFSNDGEWLVSGGDDKRVLIWNIDKTLSCSPQPKVMKGEHNSNIFCLGFSHSHTKLFSAGNDEQVILHDVRTGEVMDVFIHDEAVYGLSVDPINESIFASACDDGRILIWDIRIPSNDSFTLAHCNSAFHAVMYNPLEPRFLATANAKDGVCLWDVRKPKEYLMRYGSALLSQSAMSVRFNSVGTHLLALRRRFPPVLYEITSTQPAAEFDHKEYYNSCTMKSCCFAGDKDQYIISGSDDFKLYVWKIPDSKNNMKGGWVSKAHFVLRGHRSIVNQVRYNNTYGIIASSGVEKVVKLWSSFPVSYRDDTNDYVSSRDSLRRVYSHEEYINLVLESGQFMTHDYSHHSVQEDPRMMAFFDSLVQRDIEGWTSDSSNATEAMNTCYVVQSSDSMTSSVSSTSSDEGPMRLVNQIEIRGRMDDSSLNSMSLAYLTQRALESESSTAIEEDLESSQDRISMLIAKKRREQMLKATKQLRKKSLGNEKKHDKYPLISGNDRSACNAANGHSSSKRLSLMMKADKRKVLRRKRARLVRDPLLEQRSSDSDESSLEINDEFQESHGINSNENYITASPELFLNENESLIPDNAEISLIDSPAREDLDLFIPNATSNGTGLSNSTSDSINSNETSNGVNKILNGTENPIDNNFIYFPTKSGKRNNRNYRKRSAEDNDDN